MTVASLGCTSFALGAHFIPGRRLQIWYLSALKLWVGGAVPVPQFSRADIETVDWHCPVWMKLVLEWGLELTLEPGGGAGARTWNHHQAPSRRMKYC